MLLPVYLVTLLVWVLRPWPVWHRFVDMCLVPRPSSLFNYRCHPFRPRLQELEYVYYDHNIYNRAFECTRYVMPVLLIALQLAMLALLGLYWHAHTRRKFRYVTLT